MSNKSFEGLLKIGMTEKDPEARRKELQGTGVPHPFDLEYSVLCDDFQNWELKAHKKLSQYRENSERMDGHV